ncbi:S-layer family protein [Paenibacillus cellulosilyticus]|uniref:S-layer family protein n=1 Tax=Paenibacillus cellulosilyticus TaxID=375489 RepID=A0A2V2YRA2_9BACL|nr:S-layer homology domain-containing protein [Paenibacillus cellulosilyticus]PWV99440.1 S-layer family protein [Paenibacillus cellulosilyticus]QKS44698.1 S-layer homology domain-containing protein [Paenibacillus cellulosilyticus]
MIKKWLSVSVAAVLLTGSIGLTGAAPKASAADQSIASEQYNWGRATVVGGGFIPGIIFNQKEKDLIYARTDMGGAYRWDAATSTWKQLLDFVSMEEWNMMGVESLATDPVEPNRLYVAAGTYSNDFTKMNGVMLRSTDKGETWQRTELPFKFGGNMPGRSMGERLVIDPNNNSVLYFGARNDNGLWRSTDYGATWSKVESFTAPTDVKEYYGGTVGPVWITFDPTTGSAGQTTQTIYVGVADRDTSIYRSTDGGTTWEPVPDQPKQGFLPHHGVLSSTGQLYITYNSEIGPYDGGTGSVWKFDTTTGVWTDISPSGVGNTENPYGGLAVDAQHPDTIMVSTLNKWYPDDNIYRSTDGGATWKPFFTLDYSVGWPPARDNNYTIDYSKAPWLDWGEIKDPTQTPERSPKLGWMMGDLEIDPFNSDRMMYGTGATLYGSLNATALDSDENVNIEVMASGIEETAVNGLISTPEGASLLSAMGDIGGFRHEDLTKAPSMITNPYIGSATDIDYAELNSNIVVRVGYADGDSPDIGISQDNGVTWTPGTNVGSQSGAGWVAVSANGGSIVWSSSNDPVNYSTDLGSTWTESQGIPQGAVVSSDRVNPNKIYGTYEGTFYVSTDGGATFSAQATGLPEGLNSKFKAVPGKEGDIWIAGAKNEDHPELPYGLFHSTDSGSTFTKVSSVVEAATVGFGKAAPNQTYPAIYMNAKLDGNYGFYRSNDGGSTWVRINDDQHQYANANRAITGDPNVYGRVYIATNGFGIVVGDTTIPNPTTPTDPITPTTPTTPTTSGGRFVAADSTDSGQGTTNPIDQSGGEESNNLPTDSFKDIGSLSTEMQDAIHYLYKQGVVNGITSTTFAPQAQLTRAQFITMILRALGIEPGGTSSFNDVASTAWYAGYIGAAQEAGIVTGGGNGNFDPNRPITRQELCVILLRALQAKGYTLDGIGSGTSSAFKDADSIAAYAADAVEQLVQAGIVQGRPNGTFGAQDQANRGEAAVLMYRLLQQLQSLQ